LFHLELFVACEFAFERDGARASHTIQKMKIGDIITSRVSVKVNQFAATQHKIVIPIGFNTALHLILEPPLSNIREKPTLFIYLKS
jgi:hypothetical protein